MTKQQYIDIIYNYLIINHCDYYETCFYTFIYEAIENTLKDLKLNSDIKKETLEAIHKHIINNYI